MRMDKGTCKQEGTKANLVEKQDNHEKSFVVVK